MSYQADVADATVTAANEFFRYARATAPDKLDWKPEGARSVLDIAREVAWCPLWAVQIMGSDKPPEFNEEKMAEMQQIESAWTTIDRCREVFDEHLGPFLELARSMPDGKLAETRWLPFEGGRDYTFREMLDYPRWNITYHTGQVAYIQTMYGDREMH